MNQYELTLVFKPELTEKDTDAIVDKLGVKVTGRKQWGKRLLAYPIMSLREGVYVHATIQASPEKIKSLDQKLKLNDSIIRYLLVTAD